MYNCTAGHYIQWTILLIRKIRTGKPQISPGLFSSWICMHSREGRISHQNQLEKDQMGGRVQLIPSNFIRKSYSVGLISASVICCYIKTVTYMYFGTLSIFPWYEKSLLNNSTLASTSIIGVITKNFLICNPYVAAV